MKRPTKLSHKKMVNNITHCYLDADPVQIKGGMAWYAAAYDAAYDIGNKYGIGVYLGWLLFLRCHQITNGNATLKMPML